MHKSRQQRLYDYRSNVSADAVLSEKDHHRRILTYRRNIQNRSHGTFNRQTVELAYCEYLERSHADTIQKCCKGHQEKAEPRETEHLLFKDLVHTERFGRVMVDMVVVLTRIVRATRVARDLL
jgi:hypothetical protein